MADATQVSFQLIQSEVPTSPPDDLISGDRGAVYTDAVKLTSVGEFKRGALLMSGSNGYVTSTQAGISTASNICILADDVTINENEYAEVAAYFEGEFNDARIILPFETKDDDHNELIEAIREPLRAHKIFIRHLNS